MVDQPEEIWLVVQSIGDPYMRQVSTHGRMRYRRNDDMSAPWHMGIAPLSGDIDRLRAIERAVNSAVELGSIGAWEWLQAWWEGDSEALACTPREWPH